MSTSRKSRLDAFVLALAGAHDERLHRIAEINRKRINTVCDGGSASLLSEESSRAVDELLSIDHALAVATIVRDVGCGRVTTDDALALVLACAERDERGHQIGVVVGAARTILGMGRPLCGDSETHCCDGCGTETWEGDLRSVEGRTLCARCR